MQRIFGNRTAWTAGGALVGTWFASKVLDEAYGAARERVVNGPEAQEMRRQRIADLDRQIEGREEVLRLQQRHLENVNEQIQQRQFALIDLKNKSKFKD